MVLESFSAVGWILEKDNDSLYNDMRLIDVARTTFFYAYSRSSHGCKKQSR